MIPKTLASCSICIPENHTDDLSQDKEYCFIKDHPDSADMRIGFHEYDKIYAIPGLYEHLFYDLLKCASPQKICELLVNGVDNDKDTLKNLCVFDMGAGNGIVGELLQKQGVQKIYGMDILPEAKIAAQRDRPGVYLKYFIADLTQLSPSLKEELIGRKFNCMVSAGSLGFGDICVKAFKEGLNLLSDDAWVVFSIHSDFLSDSDCYGFYSFFHELIDLNIFKLLHRETYIHRLSAKGKPIHYTAVLGKKLEDVPDGLVKETA